MRIAVLFGGTSEERDVSVASGAQAVQALGAAGHEVVAVDTARGVLGWRARTAAYERDCRKTSGRRPVVGSPGFARGVARASELRQVDVVFIALHGGSGEDGTLQALLDLAGIPYTGSGHMGSAYAMDKDVSKRLFRSVGVPTPDWIMAPASSDRVLTDLGLPLVVKPNKQGSTVGLTLVRQKDALESAIETAFRYDDEVMLERFVPGRELTVGVLEGEALAVGEIRPRLHDIFDYASKYQPDGAEEIFPADLPVETTATVRALALAAHRAVKAGSYSRVDFRLDDSGQPWCLEVNTVPGMTRTSLLPQSAQAVGISFPELCDRICRAAITSHQRKTR